MSRRAVLSLSAEAEAHLRWIRSTSEDEISRTYHSHELVRHMQLRLELSDDASVYLRDLRASPR